MEEILHQLTGNLSNFLQGFIHPRCRIPSTNIWMSIFFHLSRVSQNLLANIGIGLEKMRHLYTSQGRSLQPPPEANLITPTARLLLRMVPCIFMCQTSVMKETSFGLVVVNNNNFFETLGGYLWRSFHWQLWMEVSLDGFETWQGSHHDRVNSSLTDFRAHCSELYIKDLQNRAILSQMNCCIFFKQGCRSLKVSRQDV